MQTASSGLLTYQASFILAYMDLKVNKDMFLTDVIVDIPTTLSKEDDQNCLQSNLLII